LRRSLGAEEIARRKEEEIEIEAWHRVYEGLSEEEVAEVEAIALNRSHFLKQEALIHSGAAQSRRVDVPSRPWIPRQTIV